MSWLESLIYGLVSGFAEFLPISSHAHQEILMCLFGVGSRDPMRDLLVHIAMLFAVYSGCRGLIDNLRRERGQQLHSRRIRGRISQTVLDNRFVKNAALPMLAGILILSYIVASNTSLLQIAAFLLINGLILFISGRMLQGNKDARSMSLIDSVFAGILSSLSAFSGISRVGCITSASITRGAARQHALDWALLLSIPALFLLAGMDILNIITNAASIHFWKNFFSYITSSLGTFIGGYYSIMLMKFLAVRKGFSGFSYYCWGAALFSFLLYLTIA
jgi:undecaprenyl-diphosphatase